MSKYANAKIGTISASGGAVRVTIALTVGQGNGGTSLPCKGCFVSPASGNSGVMRMNIAAAASATVGIELGDADTGSGPLFVPVDDVSSLYFYGTNADVVDILYLRG